MGPAERMTALSMVLQFAYSVLGLVGCILCVGTGAALLVHGVAGTTSWTASLVGLGGAGISSQLTDAPAGVVFCIVGLFLAWVTRFGVTFGKVRGP
jgi:hypothetical protein